jgi:hypothetical protein
MHPNKWKVPARKLPQVYQNQADFYWMTRRLFQRWTWKQLQSLNKFISNSSALKNKERITTSSRKGNWVPKVVCTVLWSLPGIKRFSTIGKDITWLVGKVHRPSFLILLHWKIKRESRLVPGKETGFQKSCVQYSGVYQESNAFRQLGKILPGWLGRSIVLHF